MQQEVTPPSVEVIPDGKTSNIIERDPSKLWDEIGFHKPMAGFWFSLTYTLIGILISATLMGYFMQYFYPYPESWGYRDIAYGLFGFLFTLFDVATGAVMGRFLPEANIQNPAKMMRYIQYFIWYQMISGLIQTTVVSVYAIFFATRSGLAYLVWIMLICSTTQYPGFLGVFANVLDSLQQYHKAQTSRFIGGTIVQRVIEIVFILSGRYWGESNPQIGAIMGIAIGSAIGLYAAQFTAMIISGIFFKNIMKTYGIKLGDCFKIEFTWEDVKPPLIYAFKTGLPSILGGALQQLNLYVWIFFMPQYTTILILSYIGGSISDIINWFGTPSITALVSESYMNNKKQLTQYYIGQLFRFNAMLQGFFAPLLITVYFVIPHAWVFMGMIYYYAATVFILPRLLKIIIIKYMEIPGQVIYGGNRPNYGMIMGTIQSVLFSILVFLYVAVWKIPTYGGLTATALVMEWGGLPLDLTFGLIAYIYVHKTMVKVKLPLGQIFFGFVVPSLITLFFCMIIKFYVFDPIFYASGFVQALIPAVILLFLTLLFCYFPLTALLGGWDETNLEEFRKTAYMSGPSKIFVIPIYKIISWVCSKSPLHGRFQMPVSGVLQEANELLNIKVNNRENFKAKKH
jgi:hypothetical protein